ncbi:MAG: alpha/beta hydrolase [Desulfobacterales bacterium]|nr:alpha/beta hydrolase [Desulfobacterales bacterium]MCP4158941.1 alpha/beta hydrolase [Deltaproteobacteria bacterium]
MKTKFLSINYNEENYKVSTSYREGGDQLLFFIHGLGCSKDSFIDVFKYDFFSKYSILTIDLPGFGNSEKKDLFPYKMEDHADICAEVLKLFSFNKLHIVAHSMGGAVGLILCKNYNLPVETFANLEGNLITSDCGIISRRAATLSYKEFYDNLYPELMKNKRDGRFFIHESSPKGFYESALSLVKWSDSGELIKIFKDLPCKQNFFYGSHNQDMEILKQLYEIEKTAIEDCGHFMMNDNSDDFYLKVKKFIG